MFLKSAFDQLYFFKPLLLSKWCYNKGVWLESYLCMLPPAGRLRSIREAVPMKLNCMDVTSYGNTHPWMCSTKKLRFKLCTSFCVCCLEVEKRVCCHLCESSSFSRAWAMARVWNNLLFSGSVIFAGETAGSSHISHHVEKGARCCSGFNQNLFFSFNLSDSKRPLSPKGLFPPLKYSICSVI